MKFLIFLTIFIHFVFGQQLLKFPLVRHKSVVEKLLEQNTHPKHLKKILGTNSKLYENFNTPTPPTEEAVKIYKALQSQFYAEILIGHPGQKFKMALDLAADMSWVPSVLCSPFAYPACALKNRYDSAKSTTYASLGKNYTIAMDKGKLFGFLAKEKFHIGHLNVGNQTFVEVEEMDSMLLLIAEYDGVLGLSFDSSSNYNSFMTNLFRQYPSIPAIFSLYINRDETTSKGGTLFIGGSEKKHYNGTFTYLPIKEPYYWSFKMDKVSIDYILPYRNTTAEVCSGGCEAFPTSGNVLIQGPKEDIKTINRLISANYVPYLDRYEVSCNSILKLPVITFYLRGKPFPLKGKHYIQKLAYGPLTICLSAFTVLKVPQNNLWGLGASFMEQYYMEFDLSRKRVGIVPARNPL